jgi:hypothetical protein
MRKYSNRTFYIQPIYRLNIILKVLPLVREGVMMSGINLTGLVFVFFFSDF